MEDKTLHRNIFQRIFGICATRQPSDEGCWTFENGKIVVDLTRAPELSEKNGAIRLEKKNFPGRVLVVYGNDGEYHTFKNYCTHGKRRLDPVPEMQNVQCCSIGKSKFDYRGKMISGFAKDDMDVYKVVVENGKLEITL